MPEWLHPSFQFGSRSFLQLKAFYPLLSDRVESTTLSYGCLALWYIHHLAPIAHPTIFSGMGKVLCGASSKAGGKGVTSTVPSMEEQTPQASSVEEGKWVLFLSEKELEKVRCTENCSKRSEVSGRRRQVVRLCPGLPMLLTRAIRTHHSVDCASCYLALSTKLGLM